MAQPKRTDDEPPGTAEIVTEYVRDYILACRRRKQTFDEIAERLHVSKARVIQVSDPEGYPRTKAGLALEEALANLLHEGSIDALRAAARSFVAGSKARVIVEGEQRVGEEGQE
jgi:hypothetical protein